MKLSFDLIKKITVGAVGVEEDNGTVSFDRFTKAQQELYKNSDSGFYLKTFATAGVKLLFKTDSVRLFLKVNISRATFRKYFSLDVIADGKPVGYIDNFFHLNLPPDYAEMDVPEGGIYLKEFNLGSGEKTVCIHLPWSKKAVIEELILDDGAYVEPIRPRKKLLAFGDSITQGYDALRSSNRYAAKLAELLGAEEFNKGIGGERFSPELAKLKDNFKPDFITVAYGTNDWSISDEKTFRENCTGFFKNLSKNYPDTKIFAITPIWRKDTLTPRSFGDFKNIETVMKKAVNGIENVILIGGYDFVPKDERYFADLMLHPNDDGFEYYTQNLYKVIAPIVNDKE